MYAYAVYTDFFQKLCRNASKQFLLSALGECGCIIT